MDEENMMSQDDTQVENSEGMEQKKRLFKRSIYHFVTAVVCWSFSIYFYLKINVLDTLVGQIANPEIIEWLGIPKERMIAISFGIFWFVLGVLALYLSLSIRRRACQKSK